MPPTPSFRKWHGWYDLLNYFLCGFLKELNDLFILVHASCTSGFSTNLFIVLFALLITVLNPPLILLLKSKLAEGFLRFPEPSSSFFPSAFPSVGFFLQHIYLNFQVL